MKALYFTHRLFILTGIVIVLFLLAYPYPFLFAIAKVALFSLFVALIVDIFLLFRIKKGLFARRSTPEKFSNGDPNPLTIGTENYYPFQVHLQIIDELPFQFQARDTVFETTLLPAQTNTIEYELRPTKRGEYHFGALNVYVTSPLGLARRRYRFSENAMVPVYPSYIQMRKYELLAISNRLKEYGLKKIRRIGHSMEFEQIKEYVVGDDYRTINWKATARRNSLMVNQFTDERSQQIYCVLDMGRVMKMPFEGLSLLDYAINAALVISNIAIKKGDKAGLITLAERQNNILPAGKRPRQMRKIQEMLYNADTRFLESDYEKLYATIRHKLNQRSLLLLFTNFATLTSLKRQLPFLKRIAKRHLLVVVFFENTELQAFLNQKAGNIEEVYQKIIAEKFSFDKKLIVNELKMHGIQTILTAPEDLTVNTINKYLELKARGLI